MTERVVDERRDVLGALLRVVDAVDGVVLRVDAELVAVDATGRVDVCHGELHAVEGRHAVRRLPSGHRKLDSDVHDLAITAGRRAGCRCRGCRRTARREDDARDEREHVPGETNSGASCQLAHRRRGGVAEAAPEHLAQVGPARLCRHPRAACFPTVSRSAGLRFQHFLIRTCSKATSWARCNCSGRIPTLGPPDRWSHTRAQASRPENTPDGLPVTERRSD